MFRFTLTFFVLVLILAGCSRGQSIVLPTPTREATIVPNIAPSPLLPTPVPADETAVPVGEPAKTPASTVVAHSHGEDRAHETPGHLQPGPHLKVTGRREPNPEDLRRARQFIQRAHQALDKYQDYQVALQEGYQIFAPEVPQEEYHFINPREALRNINSKDPTRPTALLYKKVEDGYQWVGAMYSAPLETPEEALDEFFPLGVTQWHAHINICVPREIRDWESLVIDSQFGLQGSIDRKTECDAAGGRFLPDLFGWMAHVDLSEAQ